MLISFCVFSSLFPAGPLFSLFRCMRPGLGLGLHGFFLSIILFRLSDGEPLLGGKLSKRVEFFLSCFLRLSSLQFLRARSALATFKIDGLALNNAGCLTNNDFSQKS